MYLTYLKKTGYRQNISPKQAVLAKRKKPKKPLLRFCKTSDYHYKVSILQIKLYAQGKSILIIQIFLIFLKYIIRN